MTDIRSTNLISQCYAPNFARIELLKLSPNCYCFLVNLLSNTLIINFNQFLLLFRGFFYQLLLESQLRQSFCDNCLIYHPFDDPATFSSLFSISFNSAESSASASDHSSFTSSLLISSAIRRNSQSLSKSTAEKNWENNLPIY